LNAGTSDLQKQMLLGDFVVVTPLLDRLMRRGHLLKFEGKSWRLSGDFDPARGGGV
jgi:hypothetical protein